MLCPKCHYDNLAENSFCTRCGTPLPEAKKAPQPEAPKANVPKGEVRYYQDPKKKDKESRGCGCIILVGVIILVLSVLYYIADESDEEFDANSNTNQVTASETADASAQGEGRVSDTVRIVVDGNVLLEDYRPKKRGDTLLFPAMAITRAGNGAVMAEFDDDVPSRGYTRVSNDFGTPCYTMNRLDYFPEYGIMEENHEQFNPCYRLKTQPIVEDGEVYVDLETIRVITAMDCNYDEAAGVLNLTFNPANVDKIYGDVFSGGNTDLWIYIPYPDGDDAMDLSMDPASYFGYIKQYVN